MPHHKRLAVIGGGPAGLRAAEVAAMAGMQVTLFDGMRSVGRKFLVAGKGGLNLTHGEAFESFASRYTGADLTTDLWRSILTDFDSTALRAWAADLGVETFQATSGRVYPKALKAAPLLRRWIARLKEHGVRFEMNHRWSGLRAADVYQLEFSNGKTAEAETVIFALGGGSWPQTGSDGAWLQTFQHLGIACNPLSPANCGWEHPWPSELLPSIDGQPLKNIKVSAANIETLGELMITQYGLEGGAIYQLGNVLRSMDHPAIHIDFKPTFSHAQLLAKMESVRRHFLDEAKIRWRLSGAAHALLSQSTWEDAASLATAVKHFRIALKAPRPLAEAISSAGGVCWRELTPSLMLQRYPGVFVAGEMIDWEAPTGGYLMQGCFATGTRTGTAAAAFCGLA